MPARALIVETARSWLGTPYRNAHSMRGVGSDCLGLLRGVWRELYGSEPEAPPKYGPGWYEVGDSEPMLDAAHRYLSLAEPKKAIAGGDVLMFRMHPGALVKHCGIATADGTFVHAYRRGRGVVENTLTSEWLDCLHSRHAFPGVY